MDVIGKFDNDNYLYNNYMNANGNSDDPDEDTGEPDTTESTGDDESGVAPEDLPKFRTLVKAKKSELKAKYGKAKIQVTTEKKILGKMRTVPLIPPKITRGWRFYWKSFKRAGGKAQLKQQAEAARKGLGSSTNSSTTNSTTNLPISTDLGQSGAASVDSGVKKPFYTETWFIITAAATGLVVLTGSAWLIFKK